jgi:hypothetical protein
MVAEMSSSENGGDKAAWINAMLPAFEGLLPGDQSHRVVRSGVRRRIHLVYRSSPHASAAFVSMSLDPYFNP